MEAAMKNSEYKKIEYTVQDKWEKPKQSASPLSHIAIGVDLSATVDVQSRENAEMI